MNFFRIFEANLRGLTSSTWFSAFIFSQVQISSKNSGKIQSVSLYLEWPWIFSKFFESMCASVESLKFLVHVVVIETPPLHPIKNFKDFSETHIDSKNSKKIHGYLWWKNKLLWIFLEFLESMCFRKYTFETHKWQVLDF